MIVKHFNFRHFAVVHPGSALYVSLEISGQVPGDAKELLLALMLRVAQNRLALLVYFLKFQNSCITSSSPGIAA